ncbi:MAG TPA: hypothetical protein VJ762_00760 [Sphingobium sp.]|nr:hypothetical protein [Sphingobium sp.]
MPGLNVALPSDSVAFSGSLVPPAKSNSEKLDAVSGVELVDCEVSDAVDDVVTPPARVVVDPDDVVVDVVPFDNIVAAPAATTHRIDKPAPTMEPFSFIFIVRTPAIKPHQGPIGRLLKSSGQERPVAKLGFLRRAVELFRICYSAAWISTSGSGALPRPTLT